MTGDREGEKQPLRVWDTVDTDVETALGKITHLMHRAGEEPDLVGK